MAQVLNLTGSLIQEVNPVDKLEYINLIENLTILELGENQVDLVINIKIDKTMTTMMKVLSWNKTIFGHNPKLERFSMANNKSDKNTFMITNNIATTKISFRHDIILTNEMIFDFFNNTRLNHLDLSQNSFICSEQVPP